MAINRTNDFKTNKSRDGQADWKSKSITAKQHHRKIRQTPQQTARNKSSHRLASHGIKAERAHPNQTQRNGQTTLKIGISTPTKIKPQQSSTLGAEKLIQYPRQFRYRYSSFPFKSPERYVNRRPILSSPIPAEQLHGYVLWIVYTSLFFALTLLIRAICRIFSLSKQMRAAAGLRSTVPLKAPSPELQIQAWMETPPTRSVAAPSPKDRRCPPSATAHQDGFNPSPMRSRGWPRAAPEQTAAPRGTAPLPPAGTG